MNGSEEGVFEINSQPLIALDIVQAAWAIFREALDGIMTSWLLQMGSI